MSANPMLSVKVEDRIDCCGDVMVLSLVSANGQALPTFEAGAHVDVKINNDLTRQYSLCNDPQLTGQYKLGILKDPESRGGSIELHNKVAVGDVLEISAPKNLFPLEDKARMSVLVGGGIGITPLLAMAHTLNARGEDFILHYCVRDEDKASFAEEFLATPFADRIKTHFDDADGKPTFSAIEHIPEDNTDVHIYTCGPTGFMDWIFTTAENLGYSSEQLHREDFSAEVDLSGHSFIVEAEESGVTVEVKEGQSIAKALQEQGIDVDVSCEEGICGTCLTDIIEGEADHRDQYLTDEEKEEGELILICCSRAKSAKLVLDI